MSADPSFSPHNDLRQKMPWLIIARSVPVTLDLRMILFAAIALVATVAGWRVLDTLFSGSEDTTLRTEWAHLFDNDGNRLMDNDKQPSSEPDRAWPWEDKEIVGPVEFQQTQSVLFLDIPGIESIAKPDVTLTDSSWWMNTPLVRVWTWLTKPTFYMFRYGTGFAGFVCLLLSVIWAAMVWGLFGGAITRYAAVALTTEERLGWSQMFWQARARWLSYVSAPLIPIFAALLFAIPLVVGGWILRIPEVGPFVIGLGWILAIIGGVVMAVTLVPPLFGWPFMWSTISTEGSDAMDGCSRCYSYVWQRPLRFICYLLFAGLLSWVSLLLVEFLVGVIASLSGWAVGLGAGQEVMDRFTSGEVDGLAGAGSNLFAFWIGALKLIVPAYAFAFFFTAMTAIYLLLRYEVDAAELDEVFLEEEPEPLATLGQDAAGVATAPTEEATGDAEKGDTEEQQNGDD
jgi:hypothetical protein